MSKKPDLTTLLAETAGSTRMKPVAPAPLASPGTAERPARKASRPIARLRPITGHFPSQVRDQLKILAVENGKSMKNLIAEAFNDLFSKYGKPEIAPIDKMPVKDVSE